MKLYRINGIVVGDNLNSNLMLIYFKISDQKVSGSSTLLMPRAQIKPKKQAGADGTFQLACDTRE